MDFTIHLSTSSDLPIYAQIVSQLKDMISKHILEEDTLLPSMRLLAKDLNVSVITTKRAYEELEREGFIYTIPSKGSYVSKRDPLMIREYYTTKINTILVDVVKSGKTAGISEDDIVREFKKLWKEEESK